ncbi:hypothetical protein G7054_g1535 [Neopestalotiopsis clavispora]|nr:hypothetical protein G7054_g1535 [Neopestalotiopsis clavispora]
MTTATVPYPYIASVLTGAPDTTEIPTRAASPVTRPCPPRMHPKYVACHHGPDRGYTGTNEDDARLSKGPRHEFDRDPCVVRECINLEKEGDSDEGGNTATSNMLATLAKRLHADK